MSIASVNSASMALGPALNEVHLIGTPTAFSNWPASRPRLAAGSSARVAWNRFEHRSALVAAASRGRLAVRQWHRDALVFAAGPIQDGAKAGRPSNELRMLLEFFPGLGRQGRL